MSEDDQREKRLLVDANEDDRSAVALEFAVEVVGFVVVVAVHLDC